VSMREGGVWGACVHDCVCRLRQQDFCNRSGIHVPAKRAIVASWSCYNPIKLFDTDYRQESTLQPLYTFPQDIKLCVSIEHAFHTFCNFKHSRNPNRNADVDTFYCVFVPGPPNRGGGAEPGRACMRPCV
jgi:hypothetical protein